MSSSASIVSKTDKKRKLERKDTLLDIKSSSSKIKRTESEIKDTESTIILTEDVKNFIEGHGIKTPTNN